MVWPMKSTFNLLYFVEDSIPEQTSQEPKILSASPDIIMAKANEHILLTCTVISETPLTYKWYRNDEELDEGKLMKYVGCYQRASVCRVWQMREYLYLAVLMSSYTF